VNKSPSKCVVILLTREEYDNVYSVCSLVILT
jgi:hypothetical protein